MAEATRPARRSRRRGEDEATKRAARDAPELEEQDDSGAEAPEEDADARSDDGQPTLMGELRGTIRDAAIEVLRPVARKATTSAAKYAVSKGPDLVKDKVAPKVAEAGGAGALAKGVLSKGGNVGQLAGGIAEKVGGKGKGGKKPTGYGRGRRLPVQEYVDVAVDLQTAYDEFTQFEDFPKFMHRVEKIEQRDDSTLMWHENIWGVRRSWEAEIVEQKPCERIVWRGTGQTQTTGVVTFHRLSDNLTRIYVNLDFQPKGMFEKAASGMRLSRRALRSDLMRFKAFVEMRDEATGSWRGRIEDGDVVDSQDERDEPEASEDERDEPEASEEEDDDEEPEEDLEDEEPEAEAEDEEPEDEEEDAEPEAEGEEDYVDEDEEEGDEEESPRRQSARPRTRSRTTASPSSRRR
jgi:uncharacterized membrane protein